MRLRDIALNNIRRRKAKMMFLVLGMMIGLATIVAINHVTQALEEDVRTKMDEYGANIVVTPKTDFLSLSYGGISIPGAQYDVRELPMDSVDKIYTIHNKENLATVSPKLLGALKVDGVDVLVVGVDLASEIKLKKWWQFTAESNVSLKRSQRPSPIDPERNETVTEIEGFTEGDVILGYKVAERLSKKPGDTLYLSGSPHKVKAVLSVTGSQDDSIIYLPLGVAQKLLDKDGITMVEVAAICGGCPVQEMARQINEKIPSGQATPVKQVVESRMQTIRQITGFGYTVAVAVLVIGSIIVFTTMTSSVRERTREIGILRAIGFKRSHIMKLILSEALTLSIIAGVLGYLGGYVFGELVGANLESVSATAVSARDAGATIALSVIVGTVATLYPARKASDIDPVQALRQI